MNTLLTDKWREHYAPVIEELWKLCPGTMSRKIARANVQQAFTFDMTRKLAGDPLSAKILAVGAYEDTASEALIKSGYDVEEIDSDMNMDLATFYRLDPTPRFDVILSTSVLEHVSDDKTFIAQVCKLLKPGGYGVLTCDFREDWKPGDPKPGEDVRLFTPNDLLNRLRTVLLQNNCDLTSEPDYVGKPDFTYGVYVYSFATYTFRKHE